MSARVSFVGVAAVFLSIAFASGVPAANAQHARTLARATVPFAFQYGNRTMPAGKYSFVELSDDILAIRGVDGTALTVVMWSDDSPRQSETGHLLFRHYGNQYALADLWVPQIAAHLRIPQGRSHNRQELASKAPQASTDVMIALAQSQP